MLVKRFRAAQQRRQLGRQPIVERYPLRQERLLFGKLRKLRRRRHPQIMMMIAATLLRGGVVMIVIMLMVMIAAGVRGVKAFPTMIERHMHAGTEPGEQHKHCDKLAEFFHEAH